MDTKDTAETTAPSVAPAKLAPKPGPAGQLAPDNPVTSVPLSGLEDDSLGSLGAACSELHVRTPECKAKEKDIGEGRAEDDREGEHVRTYDISSGERPSESAASATKHPAASSPTATTPQATHPATSSPTTAPPLAGGTCFTGMPYPNHAVEPLASEPPMAHAGSEPVASGSYYDYDILPTSLGRAGPPQEPTKTLRKIAEVLPGELRHVQDNPPGGDSLSLLGEAPLVAPALPLLLLASESQVVVVLGIIVLRG